MEEQNQNLQQEGFNENAIIKGTAELRNKPLEAALQAFVVSHVIKYFTVAAVRALINVDAMMKFGRSGKLLKILFQKTNTLWGSFRVEHASRRKLRKRKREKAYQEYHFGLFLIGQSMVLKHTKIIYESL